MKRQSRYTDLAGLIVIVSWIGGPIFYLIDYILGSGTKAYFGATGVLYLLAGPIFIIFSFPIGRDMFDFERNMESKFSKVLGPLAWIRKEIMYRQLAPFFENEAGFIVGSFLFGVLFVLVGLAALAGGLGLDSFAEKIFTWFM
jgi:hypothetical protein